jgi:carbamoyl-phosphate synthase large subunit
MADIATKVMLGTSLQELGLVGLQERHTQYYVKAPAFSFAKIQGMDAVLSPEMKSTGEAIGYDISLNRALYKAIKASGMKVQNYGTLFATISDKDKENALPIIQRFYELGFNIEATKGTADFLKRNHIKTRAKQKISDGSSQIIDTLRSGHVTYVLNTINTSKRSSEDGVIIRKTAVENNITMFTSLDTIRVLLDVLEEMTIGVSPIF